MEQKYYSADDEIAWGRLTLEEIKKELEIQRRPIKGRETDFGLSSYYTPSTTFSDEKVSEDGTHTSLTSGTSAYFTPDESLVPAVGQENRFLEKLTQAIDCDNPTKNLSPEKLVLDCNEATDTLMNMLDEEDVDNNILERIQHSLVDNTINLSPEKSRQSENFDASVIENLDESCSLDDIIVISDDSSDNLEEQSYHEISSIHVKKENANDTIQDEIALNETTISVTKSVSDDEDDLVTNQMCHVLSDISEHDFSTEERNTDNESSLNDLEEQFKLQTISTNHNLSNASSSHVFNDTMEEIEMALKQGLDYEMPNDKSNLENSTSEASFLEIPVKPPVNIHKKSKPTPNKYDYVQSRVADYIRKSPVHDNFKLPTRPPKSKVKTPNPKSPVVQTKHFKSIMSPVGVYIKNCPQVLKQNMPVKTVSSLKPTVASELFKSKEENVPFPEVVYKPGKKIVTCDKKDVVLPSSIQKLVSEPVITKHESRIARPIKKCVISKKLVDCDLTSVDSSLLNQSEDISFVKVKQAFIK